MQERYKHFAIYGPPLQGKTKLAKHIAQMFGGTYIDLLDEFQKDPAKKNAIDIFGPSKLVDFIKELNTRVCTLNDEYSSCKGQDLLLKNSDGKLMVIDQMDFLINTWDDTQFREFLVFIDQNQSEFCCMFILHNYRILEKETPIKNNDKEYCRLINIYNILQGEWFNGKD